MQPFAKGHGTQDNTIARSELEGSACTSHEFGPAKHRSWVAGKNTKRTCRRSDLSQPTKEWDSESSEDDMFVSYNDMFAQMALHAEKKGPGRRAQGLLQGPVAVRSGRLALEDR